VRRRAVGETKRRRAANGQRVSHDAIQGWYWECDHAHDCTDGAVRWWDRATDQDEAYTALEQHNAEHHPHLTEEARHG
jgi:hypothetical protein